MKRFSSPRPRRSGGEAWQTIYTDLMTIIMVFFVILWSLNQGKDIGVSEQVGDVTTRYITSLAMCCLRRKIAHVRGWGVGI